MRPGSWVPFVASLLGLASALPGEEWLAKAIHDGRGAAPPGSGAEPCEWCQKPNKTYHNLLPTQPGIQWMNAGGYCGSWSIQRTSLAKGAWISQQQVRDHTKPGGGNDNEILETNIDEALKNLKLTSEAFDYKNLPTPQADAYRTWLKKQLVAGNGVVWMIFMGHMKSFPVYSGLPYGFYSHIEPVVGVMSDKPLTDEKFYDDDYLVHYTDADTSTYYRSMKSLPDNLNYTGNCAHDKLVYRGYPCIYEKYGFGWAITGLADPVPGPPVSLRVSPWDQEPNTRLKESAIHIKGTVTVKGLTAGKAYEIHRWGSVAEAFDYKKSMGAHHFTAQHETYEYEDPVPIVSSSATYYRCIETPGQSTMTKEEAEHAGFIQEAKYSDFRLNPFIGNVLTSRVSAVVGCALAGMLVASAVFVAKRLHVGRAREGGLASASEYDRVPSEAAQDETLTAGLVA